MTRWNWCITPMFCKQWSTNHSQSTNYEIGNVAWTPIWVFSWFCSVSSEKTYDGTAG